MPKKRNLLKISEVAREAGVMPSTIRYYTDVGLLKVGGETPGGHRLYDREYVLQTISRIQFLNQQGLTIEDIKKELSASGDKKKILVIDDEPEIGNYVTEIMQAYFKNCEVKVVLDGFSAGRILGEYLPDLIVLDIMLPGIDGFEVCRQIRASKYLSAVKILAVSAYDSETNINQMMAHGANGFIPKPMDLEMVRKKMSELLGIKEIKRHPTSEVN